MVCSLAALSLDCYPYWGSIDLKECHNDHVGIWGTPTSVCNAKYPILVSEQGEKSLHMETSPNNPLPNLTISVSYLTGFA